MPLNSPEALQEVKKKTESPKNLKSVICINLDKVLELNVFHLSICMYLGSFDVVCVGVYCKLKCLILLYYVKIGVRAKIFNNQYFTDNSVRTGISHKQPSGHTLEFLLYFFLGLLTSNIFSALLVGCLSPSDSLLLILSSKYIIY